MEFLSFCKMNSDIRILNVCICFLKHEIHPVAEMLGLAGDRTDDSYSTWCPDGLQPGRGAHLLTCTSHTAAGLPGLKRLCQTFKITIWELILQKICTLGLCGMSSETAVLGTTGYEAWVKHNIHLI